MASCDHCHQPLNGRAIVVPGDDDDDILCERCFPIKHPKKRPMPANNSNEKLAREQGQFTVDPVGAATRKTIKRTKKKNALTQKYL